jgi:hypothetical protein
VAADDKILSQAEIDALLLKNAPKPKAKPPASAAVSVKQPEPPPKVKDVTPPPKAAPPEPLPKAAAPPPKVIIQSKATPSKAAPPKAAPPRTAAPSTPVMGTASYQSYTSDEVANLQKTVADLTRHVIKLTVAMQRMDMLELKVSQIASVIRFSPDSMTTFERQIEEIRDILEKMQNKNDSLRDEFQCGKCHSDKAVAVHVKCTSCGNESWMGWWPEKEKQKEPEKPAETTPPVHITPTADTTAPEET